jgi:succinate-acetate transporter protein
MSEAHSRSVGEGAVEHTGPEPPAQLAGAPVEVLVGAGGDPLILGLPIFVVGSIALGFVETGYVSAASLGSLVPIVAAATAIGQWVSCRWAIGLGQSIVACIFGIFGGFWTSLAFLVLGLNHGWFVIPTADLVHTEIIYFLSWDIIIFFLLIPVLRLPLTYIGVIVFVIVALTLVVLGLEYPGSVTTFDHLAGIAIFIFAGFGAWGFVNVANIAMGGPVLPPLGPPALK